MIDDAELRKWLLTTFLSLAVAAFSWSSAQMFGSGQELFERTDRLQREEMIPAGQRYGRSVEALGVLTDGRKGRIEGLQRITSLAERINKKISVSSYARDSAIVQRLIDSARSVATAASKSARMDSASYAALRLRRLEEPDLALLRAAETLKHAEAVDWTQTARYWTAIGTGKSITSDSSYVAAENSLEIAERGFDEAMKQGEKTRTEDDERLRAIMARADRERGEERAHYRKVAWTYGVSGLILVIALSKILPSASKKTPAA